MEPVMASRSLHGMMAAAFSALVAMSDVANAQVLSYNPPTKQGHYFHTNTQSLYVCQQVCGSDCE